MDIKQWTEEWFIDKANRHSQNELFAEQCKNGTISNDEQYRTVIKLMAEDIKVLRWFVEKLLLEARDNAIERKQD